VTTSSALGRFAGGHPTLESLIHDAMGMAAKIMQKSDAMWPSGAQQPVRR